ncbi:MAG: TolC family protein [Alphaproteobacteria bacterium]|nr:TolC family protein [Alphaproteobacteria bacterium]MCL2889729.1 TolC family protein [Alphaproteobacteria bacterium]
MRNKISAAVFAAVLFAGPAYAMDLSLATAVKKIQTESTDLKKADANVTKAKAGLNAVNANRWFNLEGSATYMNLVNVERPGQPLGIDTAGIIGALPPGLSLDAVPSFIPFPQHIGMAGLTITQPLYTFGKIGNAADAARNAIKAAESGHRMAQSEVAAAAAQIYWTAKMTDEIVVIAEKNLKASTDARRQLERAGRANRANLVKIQADIAAKEIALSDAQFNRDSAHRLLRIMAGIDMDENLTLIDNFPNSFAELDAPGKLVSNPEWDILELTAKMHDSQSRARRAARYPTLAATASYNYMAMHDEYNVFDGSKNQSASWGIAFQMPIFDGGLARANATMDAMAAESARQDLDQSKRMRSNEYNNAMLQHEHLRGNLSKLKEARDLAGRAAQISADRFASGQTSAVELSEVQAALAQMDMAVLNAKFNIIMSEQAVKKLSGK